MEQLDEIEEGVVDIHAWLVLCQSPSLVEDSPASFPLSLAPFLIQLLDLQQMVWLCTSHLRGRWPSSAALDTSIGRDREWEKDRDRGMNGWHVSWLVWWQSSTRVVDSPIYSNKGVCGHAQFICWRACHSQVSEKMASLPTYFISWSPGFLIYWFPDFLISWLPDFLIVQQSQKDGIPAPLFISSVCLSINLNIYPSTCLSETESWWRSSSLLSIAAHGIC